MNTRNRTDAKRRAVSYSTDGGETWSEPAYVDALPDPICQAAMLRVPNPKDILLFSNAASASRDTLTVRLSRDGGRTWNAGRCLHEGPAAYSCLVALTETTAACLYECGEESPYERIVFTRFPVVWVER